jgi:hypothetical protein
MLRSLAASNLCCPLTPHSLLALTLWVRQQRSDGSDRTRKKRERDYRCSRQPGQHRLHRPALTRRGDRAVVARVYESCARAARPQAGAHYLRPGKVDILTRSPENRQDEQAAQTFLASKRSPGDTPQPPLFQRPLTSGGMKRGTVSGSKRRSSGTAGPGRAVADRNRAGSWDVVFVLRPRRRSRSDSAPWRGPGFGATLGPGPDQSDNRLGVGRPGPRRRGPGRADRRRTLTNTI